MSAEAVLDLRQLARETAKKVKGWIRGECDSSPTFQELNLAILAALERAVSSRDREWGEALWPGNADTTLGEFVRTPERARMLFKEQLELAEAEAVSAERARVLEKACAALCRYCYEWLKVARHVMDYDYGHRWERSSANHGYNVAECRASVVRRAFAEDER